MIEINALPGEILMRVFHLLPSQDLKMVVAIRRLQHIQDICINIGGNWETMFQAI